MTMSNNEIAERLVELCRASEEATALAELYSPDAVSVESTTGPGMDSRETQGIDGIKGKHEWWDNSFEVHSASVDGPYPHGDDRFAVIFELDATEKASSQRMQMKEVAVYYTANGKIVREEFFYAM